MLTACAPLSHHDSPWGDASEVAGRAVLAPLTLGMSELILKNEYDTAQDRLAYNRWYGSLSADERDRVDRREGARQQALGLALIGGGPFRQAPVLAPGVTPSSRPLSCLSQTTGNTVTTNCY